jgi:hypothetical protein
VIITIIAIVVVQSLAKLAQKESEFSAKLGFAKKPPES